MQVGWKEKAGCLSMKESSENSIIVLVSRMLEEVTGNGEKDR